MKNNQLTPSPHQKCHRDKTRSKLLQYCRRGFQLPRRSPSRKNEPLCGGNGAAAPWLGPQSGLWETGLEPVCDLAQDPGVGAFPSALMLWWWGWLLGAVITAGGCESSWGWEIQPLAETQQQRTRKRRQWKAPSLLWSLKTFVQKRPTALKNAAAVLFT